MMTIAGELEITTMPCWHCEGTGIQPSDGMIEKIRSGLESGDLSISELADIVQQLRSLSPLVGIVREWVAERRTLQDGETERLRELAERMAVAVGESLIINGRAS